MWGQRQALSLVQRLQEFQRTEEVTPDRFYENVDTLRAAIARQTDSASKAIYQATLAHLLVLNASNANVYKNSTTSPADSIQEWSYQEYIGHATLLYQEALANQEALHQARAKQWIPLVKRGKDEGLYAGDMLSVVWCAMTRDLEPWMREGKSLPTADSIASFYKQHGMREAALQMYLSEIWNTTPQDARDRLNALREEYQDTEACAQVYLHLASDAMAATGMTVNERLAMLDEADRKWPAGRWKNNIENRRRELTAPIMRAEFPTVAYPLDSVRVPIATRSLRDFRILTYRLPLDFPCRDEEEGTEKRGEELLKLVRKQGRLIRSTSLQPRGGSNGGMECRDTLMWHAPECGLYATVLEASTSAPLAGKPTPQVCLVRVSRLGAYHRVMRDGRIRLTVVDSKSGQPMADANVDVFTKGRNDEKCQLLVRMATNPEGCVTIDKQEEKDIYIKVSREGDEAQERRRLSYSIYGEVDQDLENQHMAISTDRSIYRPGQQILLSAVAYNQKGWDAQVLKGEEYKVMLRDANRKQLFQHTRKTDEMGVLTDTFTLPASCLPGTYTIQAGGSLRTVRVEEYVRPTFRVELSQPQDATASKDSVAIEGKVTTYSGIPVANARITGRATWRASWWYRQHGRDGESALDTLWTDSEGRFVCKVAILGTEEELRRGRTLEVSIDALSPQGETQQGSLRIPVCSSPLRMRTSVPNYICKDYPTPWTIDLYSSTDQPVKGPVTCTLTQDGQERSRFVMQAGEPAFPEELKALASGCYKLQAAADINGDTASWRGEIELTSLADTILYHEAPLSVHAVKTTFSPTEPAKVQIGTTLRDAWVRLLMESSDTTALDTLMHLGNSCQTWTIPYRPEYGQGLTLNAYVFSEGSLSEESCQLRLELPDSKLRLQWESFRDHLRPGQQEEWSLTIKRPDGKPAQANLTASLYDASLDALAAHILNINVHRWARTPYIWAWQSTPSAYERTHLAVNFTTKYRKGYTPKFSTFDIDRFYARDFALYNTVVVPSKRLRIRGARRMNAQESTRSALGEMAYASPKAAASELTVAGVNYDNIYYKKSDMGDSAEEETEPAEEMVNLRSDLQETAFFMPRLRTDAQGVVKICFTLPESMTSWHLLGVAHTADMMVGLLDTMVVAEKELMAEMLLPRFLRSGDQGTLTASIRNRSEKAQQGKGTLVVSDTETGKVLMRKAVRFRLDAQGDTTFIFPYTGSMEHPALTVKWMAQGQEFSDGEQRYLPVLSDMQSVTETKAFSLNSVGTHDIALDKLFAHDSKEATGRSLTIEYTRDPKWLAIQTLPSMAAPTRKDAFSLASAFYAGALAYSIEQKFPEVAQAIQEWRSRDTSALESPLIKNQELTGVLLQETPWVLEADQERTRRQRLATLFDDVAQEDYRMSMLSALKNLQNADGSFSWYPGMRGRAYVTQHVLCQLARLYAMTGSEIPMQREMRERASKYLLREMVKDVKEMRKSEKRPAGDNHLRTLYALRLSGYDNKETEEERQAVRYQLSRLKKQASETDREERALTAVVLHLYGENSLATSLMERLHTLIKQPDGMHLAYRSGAFTSIDRKTSEHVQLMEAISMVEPNDTATLRAMQEWLIGMKRTQKWENATQTADAVYALMGSGAHFSKGTDRLTLISASRPQSISSPETALGYVRERTSMSTAPRKLVVEKKSQGVSYGAVYAQYQIPATKAEAQQEGLNIRRDITGVEHLQTGDRVHVRYTLTADRDYEFVRLLAPRPAAAEPASQSSGYEFTSRLGLYKSIRDASTEFFIEQLPRGTYVIEEDWLISRTGSYLLPPALLQCLYAPDFQAHTAGTTLEVR